MNMRKLIWCSIVAVAGLPSVKPLSAQSITETAVTREDDKVDENAKEFDLFKAIEMRKIAVKFIPLGSDQANVIITNHTSKPIQVNLPSSFAGVPALKTISLAQPILGQLGFGQGPGLGGGPFAGAGGPFGAGGQGVQQGGGQAVGGGFNQNQGIGVGGGNGFGIQGGRPGNGLFRIEPDRPSKLSVQTVCLEYGKTEPNPRMNYRLVPLAVVSSDLDIEVLCKQLASGSIHQNVAQAVAWNIANGLSWEELSKKNRRESNYTGNEKYFSEEELSQAVKLRDYCRSFTKDYVRNNRSGSHTQDLLAPDFPQ
jgi:hypothetical protein